jgi:hypothetical protein
MANLFKVNTLVLTKQEVVATGNNLYVNGILVGSGTYSTINALQETGSFLFNRDAAISGGLEARIAITGQQAWNAANNNGINLSGNLSNTGAALIARDLAISGGLETRIQQTGAAAIVYSNSVGFSVSGSIAQSGSNLYNHIIGGDSALSGNLTATGQTLFARDAAISGGLEIRIALTGQQAFLATSGASGILQVQINALPTSANLALTGSNLFNLITGFSGQANINFATVTNLALTGSQAWGAANNNSINLSGNLAQTGAALIARDLAISGGLEARIAITGQQSFLATSGASGVLQSQINLLPTTANLALTGSNLFILITGLSGQSVIDYATKVTVALTGQQSWSAAQNNSLNLSGNLAQTGIILLARDLAASGVVDAKINLLSGYVNLQDFTTGAANIAYSNSIGVSTSGTLALTGSAAWNAANNNGINLSGNLAQTGATLIARDNAISGVLQTAINNISAGTGGLLTNVVFTTGVQLIGGTKYFVGNTYIDNLYVTGSQFVVNTQDFYVGDNWIVMNATGGARDSALFISTGITGINATGAILGLDVPSNSWRFGFGSQQTDLITLPRIASGEAIDALDVRLTQSGINLGVIIANTGSASWNAANNNAINLSGNLTQTGITLFARDTAISGGLEARLTLTGFTAIAHANSIGSTLSGNLTQTGITLFARDAAISGGLESRIFATGAASVAYTNIYANSIGVNLSGNLAVTGSNLFILVTGLSGSFNTQIALTGSQAWNAANNNGVNLSGNLTQTGITLFARDTAISGGLEARIALTGQQAWSAAQNNSVNLSGNLFSTGRDAVGNFGQISSHSAFTSFNTTPTRWGWTFVQGNTGAPNQVSSQWYRSRVGLGSEYTIGTGAGSDFWLQMAVPRYGNKDIWFQTTENGNTGAWIPAGVTVSGVVDAKINLVSGYINNLYGTNIVYSTGNQNIAGTKSFDTGIFTGRVGIGTANPQGLLDIFSDTNGSNIIPAFSIRSNLAGAIGNYSMIRFGDRTQTSQYQKGGIIYESVAGSARGRMHLALENTDGTGSVQLSDARLTVLSNGNVGVGNTNPLSTLHISGNVRSESGYFSGTVNIADILYPRSNPSGYITGLAGTGSLASINQLNSLSGWAAPGAANYVYTTGAQTITGQKTLIDKTIIGNGTTGSFGVGSTTALNYPGIEVRNGNFVKHSTFGYDSIWDNIIRYGANGDPYSATTSGRVHSIDATITAGGPTANQMRVSIYTGNGTLLGQRTVLTLDGAGTVTYNGQLVSGSTSIANIFATQTALQNTGSAAWNAANNNSINLSGNLAQTGIALLARDLATSGVVDSKINSLSGYTNGLYGNNILYTTGNQNIAGTKSFNSGDFTGRLSASGTSGNYAMIVQSFQGATGGRGLRVSAGATAGDDAVLVTNALGTVLVRIDGVGKLGIGTATPQQALDIVGNLAISGNIVAVGNITGAAGVFTTLSATSTTASTSTTTGSIINAGGFGNAGAAYFGGLVSASHSLTVIGGAAIGVAAFQASGNQASQLIANLTSSISGAGTSFGLRVAAGTNASDYAFRVLNQAGSSTYFEVRGDGLVSAGGLVVGVAGTGTNLTIKEYSSGTQRNWGIRDDFAVDRLRFSRGASDQAFWDVLKVAASDQTADQFWYTNGAQRMQLSSTGLAVTGALSASGNLNFTGTGNRITGDFSNATIANRVSFQNSTANSATVINALPSGTGTASGFVAYNNSDPTNAALMRIFNTGTEGAIQSGINGTGTYLPMTFYTGGSERVRIDTAGNVGIGTTSPAVRLDVVPTSTDGDITALRLYNNKQTSAATKVSLQFYADNDQVLLTAGRDSLGSSGTFNILTRKSGTQTSSLFINETGNVGIGTTSPAAKLHVNNGEIYVQNTDYGRVMFVRGSTNIWAVGPRNTDDLYIRREGGSANVIFDGGNVGIGTASPASKLDVSGHVAFGAGSTAGFSVLLREYTTGTARNWGIRDDAGVDRLRFSRGSTDQVFWDVLKVAASDQTADQFWYTNGAQRMQLSSAGLAVTGALTVTGGAAIGGAALSATGNQASQLIANLTSSISGAGTSFGLRVAAGTNASDYSFRVQNQAGSSTYLEVRGDGLVSAGNGLAVTGALSCTGALAIGNTVNTVSPTSPNRTVTIVINGTTYYLHAKTTND